MRTIFTALGVLLLASCASESVSIGGPMPCNPDPSSAVLVAAGRNLPGCLTSVDGVFMAVASEDGGRVAYLATTSQSFQTREEIRIGSSLAEVRAHGGGAVVAEPGWGYYSKLPSGWCARFAGTPGVSAMPVATSTVVELFRR